MAIIFIVEIQFQDQYPLIDFEVTLVETGLLNIQNSYQIITFGNFFIANSIIMQLFWKVHSISFLNILPDIIIR